MRLCLFKVKDQGHSQFIIAEMRLCLFKVKDQGHSQFIIAASISAHVNLSMSLSENLGGPN